MTKKILAPVAAALLAVALAGCASSGETAGQNNASVSNPSGAPKTFAEFSSRLMALSRTYDAGYLTKEDYHAKRAALVREFTAARQAAAVAAANQSGVKPGDGRGTWRTDSDGNWLYWPFQAPQYLNTSGGGYTPPPPAQPVVSGQPTFVETPAPVVSAPAPVVPATPAAPVYTPGKNPDLDAALAELAKGRDSGDFTEDEYNDLRKELIKQFSE